MASGDIVRCNWANNSPWEQAYHDTVWGIPVHDDRILFKMLVLEGQQAGLSWRTILTKMDTLCNAFDDFDPRAMAGYGQQKVEQLLSNDGVIRNVQKIQAAIHNAQVYLERIHPHGSLDDFLWKYVDYKPIVNEWTEMGQVPSNTPLSDEISKDLKNWGLNLSARPRYTP